MLNQNLSKMYKLLNDIITINIFKGDQKIEIEIPYKVKRKDIFFKVLHNGVVTYHNQKPVCFVHKGINIDLSIITHLLDTKLFNTTVPLYALKGIYSISYKLNNILYVIQIKESDVIKIVNTIIKTLPIRIHKSKSIIKLPFIKSKVTKTKEAVQLELWNKYVLGPHYLDWEAYKRDYPFDYNDFKFLLKRGNKEKAYDKLLSHFVMRYSQKNEITTKDYAYYKVFMRDFSKLTLKYD